MNERLFTLIKLRNAERAIRANEQNLPSIPQGFDNKRVLGASAFCEGLGHTPMVQDKLNECKR